MRILALDSSGPVCSVALLQDGQIIERLTDNGLTHSETLMPMLDEVLGEAGLQVRDVELIACVCGPGSFTGVRIAVCAAKALAHAWGIPCAPVNALETLAFGNRDFQGVVCPILDARRGQVYCAAFAGGGTRVLPDQALALEDYLAQLPDGPLLFVGDGVSAHGPKIREMLGERAAVADRESARLRAGFAAGLVAVSENRADYLSLAPIYLRAPQAERERMARNG